ncbi:hypothetical protein EEL49_05360 [Muribaculaceae bacterium Isolate-104 (HZI)]|jgi:hypothetical protein|nr:hypothetical protein EEL49_05360 [Muribaculaceae bacterium Isolate-104 (HZI)]
MTKKIKATEQSPEWKGYDIDELRYLQAYAQARLEIEKERMLASAQSLYSGTAIKKSGIMGRILGSLTYMDYAFLAFKICRKAYSIFHRH